MGQRFPQTLLLALTISFLGFSFYLYFTPSNIISALNSYLQSVLGYNANLPQPLGNAYAFVYATVPSSFSIFVTYLVAHSVRRREV